MHYTSSSSLGRHKGLVVERVTAESETAQFFSRIEQSRLLRPCNKAIDMRKRVNRPCHVSYYANMTHHLDDISHMAFTRGLRQHNGVFTVRTYEAIINGIPEQELRFPNPKSQKVDGSSHRDSEKYETNSPIDTHQLLDKRLADQLENHNPEIVPFGYYRKRKQPRLLYSTAVEVSVEGIAHSAVTRDISVSGLSVMLHGECIPFEVDQCISVSFLDMGTQDETDMEVEYSILHVERTLSGIVLTLARANLTENTHFSDFISDFIEHQKQKCRLDPEDEICTSTALLYQRLYTENLAHVPLFLRINEDGNPCIQTIGMTVANRDLIEFFQTEDGQYDFSPLCVPSRIHHLGFNIAPAPLKYDPNQHKHKPVGEMIMVLYKNSKGVIHSVADFELNDVGAKFRFIRYAMVQKEYRIVKIFATVVRDHNIKKMQASASALADIEKNEAHSLQIQVRGFFGLALMADITDNVTHFIIETSGSVEPGFHLDHLLCWTKNKHIALSPTTAATQDTCTLLPQPKCVPFGEIPPRREDRYLARTKVEVDVVGKRYPGTTRDISTRGLSVLMEESPPVEINQIVRVGFLRFGKKQYHFDVKNIPYKVVGLIHADETRLMLERVKNEYWDEICEFFEEIIKINQAKLSLCIEDVLTTAEARLHEDVLAAHLLSVPFFLAENSKKKLHIKRIAVSEYSAELADIFYLEKDRLDFSAMTSSRLITTYHEAIKTQNRAIAKDVDEPHSFEAELYLFKNSESGIPKIEAAADFEFKTAQEKHDFLNKAIQSDVFSFYKVKVVAVKELNSSVTDDIIDSAQELTQLQRNSIRDEMDNIVGYGEIIDITRDLLGILAKAARTHIRK